MTDIGTYAFDFSLIFPFKNVVQWDVPRVWVRMVLNGVGGGISVNPIANKVGLT